MRIIYHGAVIPRRVGEFFDGLMYLKFSLVIKDSTLAYLSHKSIDERPEMHICRPSTRSVTSASRGVIARFFVKTHPEQMSSFDEKKK